MSTPESLASSQEATLYDYISQLFGAFNAAKFRINTLAAQPGATEVIIRLPLALDVEYDFFVVLNHQIGLGGPDWEAQATSRLGGLGGRGVELLDLARGTLEDIANWDTPVDWTDGLLAELDLQLREACLIYLGYDGALAEDESISRDYIAGLLVAQSSMPSG